MVTIMGQVIDFKKLSKVKLSRSTAAKPKIKLDDLVVTISWNEYDRDGTYTVRELQYEVGMDHLINLTPEGRSLLAETCLDIVGILGYKDLNLASKIKDKLLECVRDE